MSKPNHPINKKKSNYKKPRPRRTQVENERPSGPYVPPADAELAEARYYAALANPFVAQRVGVPDDGFPTYVLKTIHTASIPTTSHAAGSLLQIRLNNGFIKFEYQVGAGTLTELVHITQTTGARVRMVAAAIRTEYVGRAELFGGTFVPVLQTRNGPVGSQPHAISHEGSTVRFTPQCTKDRQMVDDPTEGDVPTTQVAMRVHGAAPDQQLLAHYVVIAESDRPWPDPEVYDHGAYLVSGRVHTAKSHSKAPRLRSGPDTTHIPKHKLHHAAPVDGDDHPNFLEAVAEGLGAMGLFEAAKRLGPKLGKSVIQPIIRNGPRMLSMAEEAAPMLMMAAL